MATLVVMPFFITSCSTPDSEHGNESNMYKGNTGSEQTPNPSKTTTPPAPEPVVKTNHTKSLPLDMNKHPLKVTVSQGTLESLTVGTKVEDKSDEGSTSKNETERNATSATDSSDTSVTDKDKLPAETTLDEVEPLSSDELKVSPVTDNTVEVKGIARTGVQYVFVAHLSRSDGSKVDKVIELPGTSLKASYRPTVYPLDDQKVGVGMPITVNFNRAVQDKSYAEKHMKVESNPTTEGSWGWLDGGKRAVWRPKEYWKPGTKVKATVNVKGLDLGESIYGKQNVSTTFEVGRSMIITGDAQKKNVVINKGGKNIRTMKASFGKPTHKTRSGDFIVYAKSNPERMVGEDYDQIVPHAMRFTDSGLYLHSADWSIGDQGRRNVSHGCVNLHPNDAKWLYNTIMMGDPVTIKGTTRGAEVWDGMGGAWAVSYDEWKKLSAL